MMGFHPKPTCRNSSIGSRPMATRPARFSKAAVRLMSCSTALLASAALAQEPSTSSLTAFAENIVTSIGQDGKFDLGGFDCVVAETYETGVVRSSCFDAEAQIGFVHTRSDAEGLAMETVAVFLVDQFSEKAPIEKKRGTHELVIHDFAEFTALREAILELQATGALSDMPACDTSYPPEVNPSKDWAALVFEHPVTAAPMLISLATTPDSLEEWFKSPDPSALDHGILGVFTIMHAEFGLECKAVE
ncbi:hypothetical protein [Tabrizicola sp.]|uniref:hypothetical protein n=1 Tax=Tabrizicola sp. TaxID=2005166 RepID=UPI003F2A2C7D